jgi:hypothetical protein
MASGSRVSNVEWGAIEQDTCEKAKAELLTKVTETAKLFAAMRCVDYGVRPLPDIGSSGVVVQSRDVKLAMAAHNVQRFASGALAASADRPPPVVRVIWRGTIVRDGIVVGSLPLSSEQQRESPTEELQ